MCPPRINSFRIWECHDFSVILYIGINLWERLLSPDGQWRPNKTLAENMAYSDTKSNRKKRKSAPSPRINNVSCPPDMTLEEWQIGLRAKAAEKERFGIIPPQHTSDPFVVTSPRSGRRYRVNYYGRQSPMNRCECMDFKTTGLGTCKHIEAISEESGGKYAHRLYPQPEGTFVYVDYNDGRKVKVYKGRSLSQEFGALIDKYFDIDGTILDMNCDPSELIRAARTLEEIFVWEPEALNLVIEARDYQRRKRLIEGKYKGSTFQGLLKTTLHPYQVDGVKFAFLEGRTINADEMGLGKTVQAIATAELLKRESLVESVIVICPTSLKYQWLAEIQKFTDSTAIVVEGDMLRRREQLANPDFFYKICSYQAMSNNIKAGHIPQADMVIYDELQRLKNRDTQMGKQLRKLQSQYIVALSGTPLENKLEELYSVTQLVDQFALGPLYKFNAETTIRDDSGKVIGYQNLHTVADKLKHTLIRRKKAEVRLQMPSRTDTNLFVPMTKEQSAIHDENKSYVAQLIFKWRRQRFLSEKDRKRLLLLLSMMRMVCDSTYILDQKTRHDTKIDEIMAIVGNLMEGDEGKVVIFSQWERMLRILAQELEGAGIEFCFLHGGVPSPKRKDLIDRFRDDPTCRVFLSTDAGATGLNLQSASLLINIDIPWNPAVLEQRIARIWRLGQQNPVQVINMIARDTIEEQMLEKLKFKSNLAAGILDGGDDAVFLDNSKFDTIIEVIDDVVIPPDGQVPSANQSQDTPQEESITEEKGPQPSQQADNAPQDTTANKESDIQEPLTTEKAVTQQRVESAADPSSTVPRTPDECRTMLSHGLALLGTLADTLRNPEGVKAMADALVKEDPSTGETTLSIPVPDKSAVVNILSAFATLLNR